MAPNDHELPLKPLTIAEFAATARCSKTTVYRWTRSGKVKIGKRILIPRAVISELFAL